MADKYVCPHCLKAVTPTTALRFRKHSGQDEPECVGSGEFVPANQLTLGPIVPGTDLGVPEDGRDIGTCAPCGRTLRLTVDGRLPKHQTQLRGVYLCANSGSQYRPVESLPDIENFAPPSQDAFFADVGKKAPAAEPSFPVDDLRAMGDEIAARLKETFYAYNNRNTDDNRSAQAHLGPSEIGTPCDRRLAMSLLRVPPTNPGGDGWAAFVGTCTHAGLAEMFLWANGGTGRYAVEVGMDFPSEQVPHGTADLLDRVLFMLDDHKVQGQWSANKLRESGPSPTYRVQMHSYGYGLRLKGERIDYVALVSWPRDKSSLDDLYVHVERYNPSIALDALHRVEDIAQRAEALKIERAQWAGLDIDAANLSMGLTFPFDASDCKFCPFYAPGDKAHERGCDGKT